MMQGLRFQVNREKMREGNMQRDQAAAHWETIRDAIYKIQNKQASTLSYEELYRTAYNLVLHKHGEMLYQNVKTTTAELLKPVAEQLLLLPDEEMLAQLNRTWTDQKLCIIMIKDILLYMNKNYVPKQKLKPVEQMQTSQFKHHVVLHAQIKPKLIDRLLAEIRSERDGQVIDRAQVSAAVQMLIEVGVHSRKIYEQEFEQQLLQETADYYRLESNQLITDSSCHSYLQKANQRLREEYLRISNYLAPTTEKALIATFLDEYVSDAHTANLLSMEASGIVHMIRNNKINELTLLYTVLKKRTPAFDLLRKALADYVVAEGGKLVADQALKTEEFVAKLISLRELIVEIYQRAMQKDPLVDLSIKMAFEKIVNQDHRTAKALVVYLDEMFKGEFKTLSEAELLERLDRVVQIFRYLEDKDVFEGYYKAAFAKRLLETRQLNEDAERALLLKLKEECGFNFTQRLEVMFKDIKMSEELTRDF